MSKKELINREYTIIGIDGGGTHTRGVLFRDNEIKATSKAGTTRIGAIGVGESCERSLNMIIDLCAQADIEINEIDAVVIGVAGVWLEEEKKRYATLIRTLARGYNVNITDLKVISDVELALEGAFRGEQGIVTIVGTGSIALGNPAKKSMVRCGGWGIELDDEGSGAWIGREGLTAVVRALDGRGQFTKLTEIIADISPIIDLKEPRTIVKAYNEGSFQYHTLTPAVMRCADENDPVCLEIIQRSAKHLVELPMALERHFKTNTVNVTLMGGIIDADTLLAKLLIEEINNIDRLKLYKPQGNALDGAIKIGLEMLNELDN